MPPTCKSIFPHAPETFFYKDSGTVYSVTLNCPPAALAKGTSYTFLNIVLTGSLDNNKKLVKMEWWSASHQVCVRKVPLHAGGTYAPK